MPGEIRSLQIFRWRRIGRAADDAAGLAICELIRADVTALNQGVRNANDAIAMLGQTNSLPQNLLRLMQ